MKLSLFTLPYAGGSAATFKGILPFLNNSSIDFTPLELPGHGIYNNQALLNTFDDALDYLYNIVKSILEKHCYDKIVFFGHSMGAILAFELVQQIESQFNLQNSVLVLSGRNAPNFKNTSSVIIEKPEDTKIFLSEHGHIEFKLLEDESFLQYIHPILKSDINICNTYSPSLNQRKLQIQGLIMNGLNDSLVQEVNVKKWTNFFKNKPTYYFLPGDHFYYLNNNILNNKLCLLFNSNP